MKEDKRKENKTYESESFTWGGGVIRINDDLEDYFSVALLHEITELWNDGYKLEDIADVYHKNPDEIFLALFHQSRNDKTHRAFGRRFDYGKGKNIDAIREIFSDSERFR